MLLSILLITYITLVVMALVHGIAICNGYVIQVDLNRFATPYYKFGITHDREYSDVSTISVLTIGLLVINIIFEFHKPYDISEEEMEELNKQIRGDV